MWNKCFWAEILPKAGLMWSHVIIWMGVHHDFMRSIWPFRHSFTQSLAHFAANMQFRRFHLVKCLIKKNFQRLYHIRLLIYKITTQSLWLHNRSKPSRPMFELIKKVTGQLLSNIISYTHHCWFLLTFKGLASVHFRLWHHLRLFQPWVQQSLNYTNKSAFCASRLIFSYLSLQALSKPRVNHFWNLCSLSFIFISDCCCFWSSRWFLNESRWPLHKYS